MVVGSEHLNAPIRILVDDYLCSNRFIDGTVNREELWDFAIP